MGRRSGVAKGPAAWLRCAAAAAASAGALTLAGQPAAAQVLDEEQFYGNVLYACTGIGTSKWDPRWSDYPAKIVFAAGTGVYLADIQATIRERDGATLFEGHCDAPWLMVGLPPGRYTVVGTAQGYTNSADFVVHADKQTFIVVRFPEILEH